MDFPRVSADSIREFRRSELSHRAGVGRRDSKISIMRVRLRQGLSHEKRALSTRSLEHVEEQSYFCLLSPPPPPRVCCRNQVLTSF